MKSIISASVLALSLGLVSLPMDARAADGAICYSAVFTQTSSGGFGTTSYPQLDNNTKFTCANPAYQYTMRQLAQGGWTISNLSPTMLSSTMSSNGSVTTQTRYMLTIQK